MASGKGVGLSGEIKPGTWYLIARDVLIDGKVAFEKDTWVLVENVEPNPQRPEHKYAVYSKHLGKRCYLSDKDFEPLDNRKGPEEPMKCQQCGKEVEPTWLLCPYCRAEITSNVTVAAGQPQTPVQQVVYVPAPVAGKKNNGLCIASMVLGICGIFPLYPLGIILGTLAS